MKRVQDYLILFFLVLLVGLEIMQIMNTSKEQFEGEEPFLSMVYENQIVQAALTDGSQVLSPKFHQLIIKNRINQPMLIFRYSGLSCKGCVQSCINALRKQFPDYETNERIMIVVSDVSASQIPENSLVLNSFETLGYDLEGTRIPHFVVYDPTEEIILHTFIPDQSDLKAAQMYLSTIANRYRL